jgi:hypothetical protein
VRHPPHSATRANHASNFTTSPHRKDSPTGCSVPHGRQDAVGPSVPVSHGMEQHSRRSEGELSHAVPSQRCSSWSSTRRWTAASSGRRSFNLREGGQDLHRATMASGRLRMQVQSRLSTLETSERAAYFVRLKDTDPDCSAVGLPALSDSWGSIAFF